MENGFGIGIVNGSHPVEKLDVENEVLESRVEEAPAVVLDESKDSEGDDVFEEAIGDEALRVDSGDIAVNEFGNAEKVEELDGSLEVSENSIVGNELETFEEAIGVPGEDGNHEEEPKVVVEEKVEPLSKNAIAELIDDPHEQQNVEEKVLNHESNGLGNNGSLLNEEDEVMELPDSGAVGHTNVSKVGEAADKDPGVVIEESEKGISSDVVAVTDSEISDKDHGVVIEESEKGISSDVVAPIDSETSDKDLGVVIEESEKGISSIVVTLIDKDLGVDADEKSGIVPEASAKSSVDDGNSDRTLVDDHSANGDANIEKAQFNEDILNGVVIEPVVGEISLLQEVDSNGHISHQTAISKEVHDTPINADTEKLDEMSNELADGSAGSYEHRDDKVDKLKEHFVNFDAELKDNQSEKLKEEASSSPVPEHLDDMDQEKDTFANSDTKKEDLVGRELKEASPVIITEHHGENCRPKDNSNASVEEGNATLEVQCSPKSEDPAAETGEIIPPTASRLEAESKAHHREGSHGEKAEVSGAVADSEKKGAKPEEVNGNTHGNREQEIKTAVNVPSLSGKYANPVSTPTRPAGLGRAAPLLEPASRSIQQPRVNGAVSQMQNQLAEDPTNGEAEENDETREKLQMIRVKFLRLAHRLGQTPHNVVVAQVLYRLGLAEQLRGRNGGRVGAFSFDRASAMAEQLEAAGQEPLDFSCTIMVLGKTGVGKSATINSIFDEVKFNTDAFRVGTKKVQDVVGTVQGIKVRVIDTPGLLPSWSDQRQNEKILHSVKAFIKKTPPDIVLYLDRLDMQSRDLGDMPLLRTITEIFGPSIWFNAIVVLTHAASAPPDGPNGVTTSYDMFVTQRSHVVQQAIRQAAGDMRLMNPVSLVENHSACRTNRAGQRVLPNGQVWKPHLLLLSFASKILAEANTLLKLQDSPPGRPFPPRTRAPPLPFLLSSLLQSRPELKLPEEQFGDDDDTLDGDLDVSSESDEESEYDELPPFKRLTKAQLAKLTKAQKKAYYDELEYREKLFMKKQLKEEKRRRKMMKKMAASTKDLPNDYSENVEEESGGAASVPVPMPDLVLPASFDSDTPTHRYRCLDSQWLVRPVLESHGWDHDVGYEGINVERLFVVKEKIPISLSGQVTKDKKDSTLQLEVAGSLKHGEGKATSLGFDMQNMGKDIAYTLRSETRFCNYRQNKATAGLSVTVLGDAITAGVKVEDKLLASKRLKLVMSGGALTGQGDIAYGGSLEATLRDNDYPLGRFLATSGLSVMDWHGDLAIGWNCQAQLPIGRFMNLIGRFNLNNRGSGQVSVRLNSSEQIQLALIGVIPLLRKLFGHPQELQFGHT